VDALDTQRDPPPPPTPAWIGGLSGRPMTRDGILRRRRTLVSWLQVLVTATMSLSRTDLPPRRACVAAAHHN